MERGRRWTCHLVLVTCESRRSRNAALLRCPWPRVQSSFIELLFEICTGREPTFGETWETLVMAEGSNLQLRVLL